MVVDHIDDDRSNNAISNLQLLTVQENAEKACAKNWIAISPEGEEYAVFNLAKFCREKGLHAGHMGEVAKGYKNQKHHKGWKCYVN